MIDLPIVVFLNTYGVVILIVLVLFYLWLIEKEQSEALHAILSLISAGAVGLILKELFSLPRPYLTNGLEPLAGHFSTPSFPSLHTILAFALGTTITLHQKKAGIIVLLAAALIGFGRVAANVHYPIDIGFGAIVGTLVALFVDRIHLPRG